MTVHKKILLAIGVVAIISFVLGTYNIFQGRFDEVVWLLCPVGIFVWGDALILGPFLAISCWWLWKKNRVTISGMYLSLYAVIRAFIEVLYNLNAQFTTTQRPWDHYWQDTRVTHFFGVIDTNVLAQVIFTVVIIVSLFTFIIYLKHYLREEWFEE
jgi:hypothetical protein